MKEAINEFEQKDKEKEMKMITESRDQSLRDQQVADLQMQISKLTQQITSLTFDLQSQTELLTQSKQTEQSLRLDVGTKEDTI